MRALALGILAAALACGAAAAREAPNAPAAGKDALARTDAVASRVLYVCDASNLTRRGFAREYGSAEFVSAQDALSGAAWTGARCISPGEAARLRQKLAAR